MYFPHFCFFAFPAITAQQSPTMYECPSTGEPAAFPSDHDISPIHSLAPPTIRPGSPSSIQACKCSKTSQPVDEIRRSSQHPFVAQTRPAQPCPSQAHIKTNQSPPRIPHNKMKHTSGSASKRVEKISRKRKPFIRILYLTVYPCNRGPIHRRLERTQTPTLKTTLTRRRSETEPYNETN